MGSAEASARSAKATKRVKNMASSSTRGTTSAGDGATCPTYESLAVRRGTVLHADDLAKIASRSMAEMLEDLRKVVRGLSKKSS